MAMMMLGVSTNFYLLSFLCSSIDVTACVVRRLMGRSKCEVELKSTFLIFDKCLINNVICNASMMHSSCQKFPSEHCMTKIFQLFLS